MRRPLIVTAAVGAALTAGLVAVPALAATTGPSTSTPCATATTGTGRGPGGWGTGYGRGGAGMAGNGPRAQQSTPTGQGHGQGPGAGAGTGMGAGRRGGTVTDPLAGLSQGTLTAEQKATLAGMAEEEKLAHDVYVKLAVVTQDARFTRIATAETSHLAEVRALLARYGSTDPTAGRADGRFTSARFGSLYADLVARGSASVDAALAVGREIENLDLKDLAAAGQGVTAQDVTTVYARLANGSRMHLRAFGG